MSEMKIIIKKKKKIEGVKSWIKTQESKLK
jgi:hypothetical protein